MKCAAAYTAPQKEGGNMAKKVQSEHPPFEEDLRVDIPGRLRRMRELNGYTQKQLAEVMGINRSTYAYYEIGGSEPNITFLVRLARLYKVTLEQMLEIDDPTA